MVGDYSTERKMFEAESNSGIQKLEEIAFGSLVITEPIFIRTYKPRHPQGKLWLLVNFVREK